MVAFTSLFVAVLLRSRVERGNGIPLSPYFGNKVTQDKQTRFNIGALKLFIMPEKTILTADLYDNVLTEKKGDYSAKPQITGTVYNSDIADRIVGKRTEFRKETIINILSMADDEKVGAIASGKSVVDGVGQYLLNLGGSFEGEKPVFDPAKHKVGVTFTQGKKLLDALKNISFNLQVATTGPVINGIVDSTTGEINTTLTPNAPAVIAGNTLLVIGDDESVGVYFTEDKEGVEPHKVSTIVQNTKSQIVIQIPGLSPGQYRLSVTTQGSSCYKQVKTPRTYTFPILLTVGSGIGDRPGIL